MLGVCGVRGIGVALGVRGVCLPGVRCVRAAGVVPERDADICWWLVDGVSEPRCLK